MSFCTRLFNTYLLATAVLLAGCASDKSKEEKKDAKLVSAIRVHIEAKDDNHGDLGTTQTISLLRAEPVTITISKEPILYEDDVARAAVMHTPGGFSVEVQFNDMGMLTLEQYSAANPGKHFAIFGQWGEKGTPGRWLAAPLITHRIANGLLSFTPDASREESERFVHGLNNVAKKNSGDMK